MAFISHQSQAYFISYLPPADGRRPYFIDYERDLALGMEHEHLFCGAHEVSGAQCPNCRKPLLRFLALNTTDPRLRLNSAPFRTLSLFYCWRCPVASGMLLYHVLDDGGIELLEYTEGEPEREFPYKEYPDFFPGAPARLLTISNEVQDILRQLNRGQYRRWKLIQDHPELLMPRHQYGGEPLLLQQNTEYEVECPACERIMPWFASIGDDCLDPRGFVSEEAVQVLYHYCQPCRVVGAFHRTD